MLQKHSVVRTAAKIAHGNIVVRCGGRWAESAGFLWPGVIRTWLAGLLPCVVHSSTLGGWHGLCDLPDKFLQTGHARCAEFLARYGHIHVEIGGRILQILGVFFAPL